MKDRIIRAMAYDAYVRAFAVTCNHTIEDSIKRHDLNPIAAIALGRALMATSMLAAMGKKDTDSISFQIISEGPMRGLTCFATKAGELKGYVRNNDYSTYKEDAMFGVGGCIGPGKLIIVRDIGLKDPYSGQVELQSGEIGDDLAYYFSVSEQIPSLVALGVKLNEDRTVRISSGVIIQLLPGASNEIIEKIENKITMMHSATVLLDKCKTLEGMLEFLLEDGDVKVTEERDISFNCNCSYKKMLKGILTLGEKELKDIIKTEEKIETVCHFCNEKYVFSSADIEKILENIKKN